MKKQIHSKESNSKAIRAKTKESARDVSSKDLLKDLKKFKPSLPVSYFLSDAKKSSNKS